VSFLKSILEDNAGGLSSIRLLMIAWALAVMVTWCVVAISTKTIPDIPTGVLTFTGMIVGGKVAQRFGEQPGITNSLI
jgi:hypothetical protein